MIICLCVFLHLASPFGRNLGELRLINVECGTCLHIWSWPSARGSQRERSSVAAVVAATAVLALRPVTSQVRCARHATDTIHEWMG